MLQLNVVPFSLRVETFSTIMLPYLSYLSYTKNHQTSHRLVVFELIRITSKYSDQRYAVMSLIDYLTAFGVIY
jgi:hypothetical protein